MSLNQNNLPLYVLITPARNEAAFIERTIQSVIAQTVPPLKWVVVSDGSTDGTDEIVSRYAAAYVWIEFVTLPPRRERHFAAKVNAFNSGYRRLAGVVCDVIGNLDADVSFDPCYFEFLLRKFAENPRLGVAGTPFTEGYIQQYNYRYTSPDHVSGAIQMFRRECFEDIGGYVPIRVGGIDLLAVIKARMKGWETKSFLDMTYEHHHKMSSAKHNVLGIAFDGGKTDYMQGCDAMWELFRSAYQMTRPPIFLRGSLLLAGFLWGMLTRTKRVVPAELIRFRKVEQRRRLFGFFKRLPLARLWAPISDGQ